MSEIQVRKNGAPMGPAPSAFDPPRWLSRMMGWDPFHELTPFLTEPREALEVPFEIKETKDAFVLEGDVPGVAATDLDVSLNGDRLTVSGKREAEKAEEGETYHTVERSYGSFTRGFTLPDGVDTDAIHAALRDGVLSIVLPKKAPEEIPAGAASEA